MAFFSLKGLGLPAKLNAARIGARKYYGHALVAGVIFSMTTWRCHEASKVDFSYSAGHEAREKATPGRKAAEPLCKLSYFDVRGTPGEQLRLALLKTVGKVDFEDDRIAGADWAARKAGMKYGQVPVFKDSDGTEHYQSSALLRYIGSTKGDGSLYPMDDAKARLRIDEMIGVADDLQKAWTPCLYAGMRPGYIGLAQAVPDVTKKMREKFVTEDLPKYLGFISDELKKTRSTFIAGDKFTIADCRLHPQLSYFRRGVADHVPADCLEAFPEIVAYLERVEAEPEIAEYYA